MNRYNPIIAEPVPAYAPGHVRHMGVIGAILGTNRFLLGGALLLALLLPEYFHADLQHIGPWFEIHRKGVEPTLVASGIAIIIAHLSLQRLGNLPLIATKGLILPTFLVSYSGVLAGLFILQSSFGRYHLWTSFSIASAWYFLVAVLRGRWLKPMVAMIGSYDVIGDRPLPNVNWVVMAQPYLSQPVSAVVVDPHASLDLEWSSFITRLVLNGVPVYHRTHLEEGVLGRVRFQSQADNDFGALLPSLTYLRLKRFFDIGMLLAVLPIVLPILLVAAIAVKLDSRGPAFFRQTRMGYRARPFTCYKLRSMHVDMKGPSFTLEKDPRVTRVGRFIRKWRIDELPQIFNVLKGDMSWIGPRPEALDLALKYEMHVPFYPYRHAVRPGITGWAAVHQGNVAEIEAAELKLEYDFYYIKYFSFWLDFLILLKTFQTIWNGYGTR